MKQSGSVQMKRNDVPAAMENRLGTTLTSLCICLPYEEQV